MEGQFFSVSGATLTVRLPGEVDHHVSEQIREQTDRLVQQRNIRRILFDFSETNFMDSSGIGMILGRYKTMRFMGGTVAAIHVGGRMEKLLDMSGIGKVIDICEGGESNAPE